MHSVQTGVDLVQTLLRAPHGEPALLLRSRGVQHVAHPARHTHNTPPPKAEERGLVGHAAVAADDLLPLLLLARVARQHLVADVHHLPPPVAVLLVHYVAAASHPAVRVLHLLHVAHHRAHLRDHAVLRLHVHALVAAHLAQDAAVLAHTHDRLHAAHGAHVLRRGVALARRRDDEGRAKVLAEHEDVIGPVEVERLRG